MPELPDTSDNTEKKGGVALTFKGDERTNARKVALLAALETSLGIVKPACEAAGVSRETYYEWCRTDSAFKAKATEAHEIALDFAETKLFQLINGVKMKSSMKDKDGNQLEVYSLPPNTAAVIFFLKTRGKQRGYIERTEVTGKDGEPLITKVNLELKGSKSPLLEILNARHINTGS